MTAPWFPEAATLTAVPIGLAFGVVLERVGLGSARTIADQLRGRDFTVVKVMLSAIVTAMLGVFWASHLGWLDLAQVAMPETDLLPQVIGSVLFGAGFSVASLCPGTACVAAGAGHRDGVAAIGGLFVGTVVVMLVWPDLGALAVNAPRPDATLAGDFGWPTGSVVAVIAIGGVGALWLVGRLERSGGAASSSAEEAAGGTLPRGPMSPLAVVAIALGLLAGLTREDPSVATTSLAAIGADIAAERDHVDPLDLAQWLKAGTPGLRLIDVREAGPEPRYRIPGSEAVPVSAIATLAVRPDETIVLYSDGGTHAAQAWVLLRARLGAGRSGGRPWLLVLRDGLAGWEDEVLSPRPAGEDSVSQARFRRARGLSLWFGGIPSATPRPAAAGAANRRRNRC
ncbi:MAG: YeeE/YedE thiosulfate transporter family protein [Gemmatimonadales bacterium]